MSLETTDDLRHILDETRYLASVSDGLDKDTLLSHETLKRAVVGSIEVIGEAAKKLPDDFRQQHSDIEWRAISGMRDHLIHGYFGIDYDIVWDVLQNHTPILHERIGSIIAEIDSAGS